MRHITFFMLLCSMPAFAQDTLTLKQAINIALEQNYAIKIAQNDAEIAQMNNTRANAGMLPLVSINASDNVTAVNFQQRLANGTEISRPFGVFNGLNVSVNLNWTFYDGGRMYLEKDRLDALDQIGKAQLRAQITETTTQVALAWLEVANTAAAIRNLNEIIITLEQRLQLSTNRLNGGLGNKSDVLQAQIDVNSRTNDRLIAINNLANAKRQLNTAINRHSETRFEISQIPLALPPIPDTSLLIRQILERNPDLDLLNRAIGIAQIAAQETKTLNKPRLELTGAGSFQRNDNTTGFSLYSRQFGPSVGLNFSLPLDIGNNFKRQQEVAKVGIASAQWRKLDSEQQLRSQAQQLVSQASTLQQTLLLEQQNLAYARENEDIASERFKLGLSNALELRTVQQGLEDTLYRITQTKMTLLSLDILMRALMAE